MKSSELKALFKRYMKPQNPKSSHALLSASGSERWLNCPASVSLSKDQPNIAHESAQVGTNAHTLLQFILENHKMWANYIHTKEAKAFREFINFSDEQLDAVLTAVDFITCEFYELVAQSEELPKMYIEKKVQFKGVGFGTSDVILYQPFGILHIIDYKNGKYKVEAKENSQGLYYAVAAADLVGWDFREVRITIIQPNAPGNKPIRTWKTTPERLEKAKLMFLRGAKRTQLKNPPVIPNNKYCWFCAARPVCPAQMKQKETKIMSRFER